jgi:hypothetical protein
VGGLPVNAQAAFTTGAGTITVVITNFQANPTSVAQVVTDLLFTVSTGQNSGSIDQTMSSGNSRTIAGDGSFTDNGSISPSHWALQTSGTQLYLNDLTGAQPVQGIIGPAASGGTYSNANGSIAGNTSHNPFLSGPVTFTLDVTGVTAASTITAATFSFNTTAGDNVTGIPVPEGFSGSGDSLRDSRVRPIRSMNTPHICLGRRRARSAADV